MIVAHRIGVLLGRREEERDGERGAPHQRTGTARSSGTGSATKR